MDDLKASVGGNIPDGLAWPHVKQSEASSAGSAAAGLAATSMHTTAELHSLAFQAKNAGIAVNAHVTEKGSTELEIWRILMIVVMKQFAYVMFS